MILLTNTDTGYVETFDSLSECVAHIEYMSGLDTTLSYIDTILKLRGEITIDEGWNIQVNYS